MASYLFQSASMKISRASGFIGDLIGELRRYANDNPVEAEIAFDNGAPKLVVHWKSTGYLPGAIAGDAIHNLRSALDHIACDLAIQNGYNERTVSFPFSETAEKLSEEIRSKRFNRTGSAAVEVVRDLKPYKGGNDLLRSLHDLDIYDKHKTLLLLGNTMTMRVDGVYEIDNPGQHITDIKPESVRYIFPDGAPLAGESVIETLNRMKHLVVEIMKKFADSHSAG